MIKILKTLFILTVFLTPLLTQAQEAPVNLDAVLANLDSSEVHNVVQTDEYYKAKILRVDGQGVDEVTKGPYQDLTILLLQDPYKDKTFKIEYGRTFQIQESQLVKENDAVIVNAQKINNEVSFSIVDQYRLSGVLMMVLLFFALAIVTAGKKGARSILGLFISLAIIIGYIVPALINGGSPLVVCLIGSLGILCITLFLAHGVNIRTGISLIGSLITLVITIGLATFFVNTTHLFGLGTEDAFFLQNDLSNLNIKGLLLGGMIIGVLGVLDDITTAQVAAIAEIKRANLSLRFKDLYERGSNIGREHIASLVNTLALAYVGVSLPLMLLVYINLNDQLWVFLNSEMMVEEIVRTLIGSLALLMAVPITTVLAAWYYGDKEHVEGGGHVGHGH